MIESGYYPPGAEYDPNAPWNEPDIPEATFDVCISQTLSKSVKVTTDDYSPEVDADEDGTYMYPDTSDTDWKAAYGNDQHYTPLELIKQFKEFLEKLLPDPITFRREYHRAKHLISECEGWIEDETEIIQE